MGARNAFLGIGIILQRVPIANYYSWALEGLLPGGGNSGFFPSGD